MGIPTLIKSLIASRFILCSFSFVTSNRLICSTILAFSDQLLIISVQTYLFPIFLLFFFNYYFYQFRSKIFIFFNYFPSLTHYLINYIYISIKWLVLILKMIYFAKLMNLVSRSKGSRLKLLQIDFFYSWR